MIGYLKTRWENSEILGYRLLKEGDDPAVIMRWWLARAWHLGDQFPFRKRMPDATVAGRHTVVLRLEAFSDVTGKFYFDREHGWLVRSEIEANPAVGQHALITTYSDYRYVGALRVPFHIEEIDNGSKTVTDCQIFEETVDRPESFFQPKPDLDWEELKPLQNEPPSGQQVQSAKTN